MGKNRMANGKPIKFALQHAAELRLLEAQMRALAAQMRALQAHRLERVKEFMRTKGLDPDGEQKWRCDLQSMTLNRIE